MGNELELVKQQTMLQTSKSWVSQLERFAQDNEINFTEYQKGIVVNTVRKLYELGFDIMTYDRNNVADILYQTAFLNLNPSAMPRHVYFKERDIYENYKKVGTKLEMGVEGEGNDEILRTFGIGIKKDAQGNAIGVHKVWVVREGDEYKSGYYNGLQYTPPVWVEKELKRGEKKGVIMKVVYPIEKTDGSVEYWSADREDLQPIILKHIEQNLMGYRRDDKDGFNKLMRELREMTFDEIIEQYAEKEITIKKSNGSYQVRIIQDSYTGSTGESMILRKLRNVALRTFPKNFDKTSLSTIYEKTFEERYETPRIETNTEEKLIDDVKENAGSIQIVDTPKSKAVEVLEVKQEVKKTIQKPEVNTPPIKVIPELEVDTEIADDFFKKN